MSGAPSISTRRAYGVHLDVGVWGESSPFLVETLCGS